jgi:hypothetical protein
MFTNGAGGATYKDTLGSGRITNFLNGFTGTTPNWTYGTQTTLNIPLAGTTVGSGTVSNGVQSYSGAKTMLSTMTADSGVIVNRRFNLGNTAITANTTLTQASNNLQICNATSASFTVTLPTATAGDVYTIIKTNNTANTVTVSGTMVGGGTQWVLHTAGSYKFVGTGSAWSLLGN